MGNKYIDGLLKLNRVFDRLKEENDCTKLWLWVDALYNRIVYGITPNQYIGFGFYRLNHLAKKSFYTARYQKRYEPKLNDRRFYDIFWNKPQFNKEFKEFVHRGWLETASATPEEIEAFLEMYPKVIIKPLNLSSGKGIRVVENAHFSDKEIKEELLNNNILIEEYVTQHPEMSKLNPSSVNTIRAYTILDKSGEPYFLSTSLRVGGVNANVDNYHSGGIGYPIDTDMGIVSGAGADIDGKRHLLNPAGNLKVVGFAVPNWENCKKFICDAARRLKSARMVAWDVAVTENGFEMIEGNYDGDSGFMQSPSQIGRKEVIKRIFKG